MDENKGWVDHFSFDDWLPKFSLDSREALTSSGLGPDGICFTELLRRESELYSSEEPGERVDSDVFVLGWGEGPTRHGTKIGGLPYFKKNDPWPYSKETGRPMDFICQFRFDESTDIVGELPGGVLLVFCNKTTDYGDDTEWHFQWCQLGIDHADLVTERDIPENGLHKSHKVPTCYGVRVRYGDYASADVVELMLETLLKYPRYRRDFKDEPWTERLNCVRGEAAQMCVMKIGGIPFWARPVEALVQQRNSGKFLALIPPVIPNFMDGWKTYWINGVDIHDGSSLHWYYEGCIHLYLTNENVVEARFSSLLFC